MKKLYAYIMGLPLCSLLFTSCVQHELSEGKSEKNVVSFHTQEALTRGFIGNDNLKTSGTKICMYGYHKEHFLGEDRVPLNGKHLTYGTWDGLNGWSIVDTDDTPISYYWEGEGAYRFFGWMAHDAASNLSTPTGWTFDSETQKLTIPTTILSRYYNQYDFLYSEVHERTIDLENMLQQVNEAVPINLKHLFTAFGVGFRNLSDDPITFTGAYIEAIHDQGSASIDFSGSTSIADYGQTSIARTAGTPFISYSGSHDLMPREGTIRNIFNPDDTEKRFYMLWPQAAEVVSPSTPHTSDDPEDEREYAASDSILVVTYTLGGENYERRVKLPTENWEAGKRYYFELQVTDKLIELTATVIPWDYSSSVVDFQNEAVEVKEDGRLRWDESTCTVDHTTQQVYVKNGQPVEGTFCIDAPQGGQWRVSLEGDVTAFSIIDDTAPTTDGFGPIDGEEEYNENVIRTLHYFFYLSGKTNENAVMQGAITLDEGTKDQAVVRIPLNDTELNSVVFPRPANECEVYVIANLPNDVALPTGNTSLAILKGLAVTANFKEQLPQASFVMDGTGKAVISKRNNTVAANASIELKRLAAKLTTRISVEERFEDSDGKVWQPVTDLMTVTFDNAVSNTTLGGAFGNQHFNYEERNRIGTKAEGENTLHVFSPFYSYPCTWDYREEKALVMYIMLPWMCEENGSSRYKDCYYKVFPNTMQLDRNSWYNMDLHIGVLGSFSPTEEPIEIEDFTYKVVDWTNGFDDWTAGLEIETEILSAHYLMVERNDYVVNNKAEFDIPFITSHKCVIKDLKVTRTNFGTSDTSKPTPEDITSTAKAGNWLTLDGNVIKLVHELNNDFINTTDYDYSPYVFTFTLCHENNPDNFYEEITITQKPAISITAHLNSYREQNPNGTNGYQFVNGVATKDGGNGADYGGAHGLTGGNKNPYMYIIEVTVLPAGSDYILGDPRSETSSVPPGNNAANAPGIEGTDSRKLQKYYGTKTDASVQNMIAPKFRIASSHGVTNDISHTNAINRAATYQEDGYPAGRWRVPTMAEVQFLIKLSADGKIPTLFSNGSAYWCANGKVTPSAGGGFTSTVGTGGSNGPVRCVYDDWYWEQSPWPRLQPDDYDVFTWGDEIN